MKRAALKFFRLHSLVAGATGQVFRHLADFAQRFILRSANHRREQSILDGHGNAKIDVGILHDGVAIERSVHLRNFHRGLHGGFQNEIVHRDLRRVGAFARLISIRRAQP